ncbi:unnamed protein product [Clonostachys byssicola]|uniref:Uncharacterized protein n=1 Tax=Clonostachys byssicola TaxID=160290 RepID=A0A9N9UGX8_9HYPO|nr:unnamed protein product [Clonostachys byssicola]
MLLGAFEYVPARNESVILALLVVVAWPCISSLRVYWSRPKIALEGPPLAFGKWLSSVAFLAQGSKSIFNSYNKIKSKS